MRKSSVRFLLSLATVLGAFFLEHALAALGGPRLPVMPLVLVVVALWLPVLPLAWRLWLAGLTGLLMDAFGRSPFGASIITLLIASLIAEILRSVVTARDRSWGHASVSGGLVCSALLLRPLAAAVIVYTARLLA